MGETEKTDYRELQKKFRQEAKKVTVLHYGRETVNLGIQEFKRQKRGYYMNQTFKENAWNSFLNKKKAEAENFNKN